MTGRRPLHLAALGVLLAATLAATVRGDGVGVPWSRPDRPPSPVRFRILEIDLPLEMRRPERFQRAHLDADGLADLVLIDRSLATDRRRHHSAGHALPFLSEMRRLPGSFDYTQRMPVELIPDPSTFLDRPPPPPIGGHVIGWLQERDGGDGPVGFRREAAFLVPIPAGATLVDVAPAGWLGPRPAVVATVGDELVVVELRRRASGAPESDAGVAAFPRRLTRVEGVVPEGYDGDGRLLRDLDGDGRAEIVVPTPRGFAVFAPDGRGGVDEAWDLRLAREVEIDLGPPDVDAVGRPGVRDSMEFRQVVRDVEIGDVDGDGRADLLAQDEGRAFAFRGREDGRYSRRPDGALDWSEFLEGEDEPLELFGKRIKVPKATAILHDLDGDGALDVAVKAPNAGRIVIVRGGAADGAPPQVIRLAGRPLWMFVDEDVSGDGLADLQILTCPEISVLSALGAILRGRFTIDILRFDQRPRGSKTLYGSQPDRVATFSVGFSVSRIVSAYERFKDSDVFDDVPKVRRRQRGDLDGDGRPDFVRDERLEDGRNVLRVFRDRDGNHWRWGFVTAFRDDILRAVEGEPGAEVEVSIEIEELYDKALATAQRITDDLEGGRGAVEVDLGPPPDDADRKGVDVFVLDVDGDGRDDVLVSPDWDERSVRVVVTEPVDLGGAAGD